MMEIFWINFFGLVWMVMISMFSMYFFMVWLYMFLRNIPNPIKNKLTFMHSKLSSLPLYFLNSRLFHNFLRRILHRIKFSFINVFKINLWSSLLNSFECLWIICSRKCLKSKIETAKSLYHRVFRFICCG